VLRSCAESTVVNTEVFSRLMVHPEGIADRWLWYQPSCTPHRPTLPASAHSNPPSHLCGFCCHGRIKERERDHPLFASSSDCHVQFILVYCLKTIQTADCRKTETEMIVQLIVFVLLLSAVLAHKEQQQQQQKVVWGGLFSFWA